MPATSPVDDFVRNYRDEAEIVITRKFAEHSAMVGHGLAIACAIAGLGLIVAAPLEMVVYGVALFGLGIAVDVIVAVNCHDSHNYRRRVSNGRSRALRARKR